MNKVSYSRTVTSVAHLADGLAKFFKLCDAGLSGEFPKNMTVGLEYSELDKVSYLRCKADDFDPDDPKEGTDEGY